MDGQLVVVWLLRNKVRVWWLGMGLDNIGQESGCHTTHLSITGVFSEVDSWGSLRTVM